MNKVKIVEDMELEISGNRKYARIVIGGSGYAVNKAEFAEIIKSFQMALASMEDGGQTTDAQIKLVHQEIGHA